MCGIFGICLWGRTTIDSAELRNLVNEMFRLSSSRGKEASGLAVQTDEEIFVYKKAVNAKKLIKFAEFDEFFEKAVKPKLNKSGGIEVPISLIGHARLVTNGIQGINANNQPVSSQSTVVVHNGIIVNDKELWSAHPDIPKPENELDSALIPQLIDRNVENGQDIASAYQTVYGELRGQAATLALRDQERGLIAATNFGSLYAIEQDAGVFVCASERRFLETLRKRNPVAKRLLNDAPIRRLDPFEACYVSGETKPQYFGLRANNAISNCSVVTSKLRARAKILDSHEIAAERRQNLKRCTKCVLPSTIPGITFDDHGVCSYCNAHTPFKPKGLDALHERLEPFRRDDGKPELIMGVSGGRDSCFGLQYVVKEFGLNTVAYTYDWALVTDLARRNISRLCFDLGIEHVLVSADIQQKRKHIRDNVNAWLRDPRLGVVPLFMAGDKMYFYYYNKLRKEMGIDLAISCGNRFEKTDFKSGFCGVYNKNYGEGRSWRPYDISLAKKLRFAAYFGWSMGKNPGYWNGSLVDTAKGFWSSYLQKHDFVWLYDYIPWDEGLINETLTTEYGWETAGDTKSTWRVGDGTAAFYNYIYYTVAGFSEHETFRSNQIREGHLTREKALALCREENKPRYESIRDYAHLIGFDFDHAMLVIDRIPKLY